MGKRAEREGREREGKERVGSRDLNESVRGGETEMVIEVHEKNTAIFSTSRKSNKILYLNCTPAW